VAGISVGDWGYVQRENEGLGFGEGLSPFPVGVWGLAPDKKNEIYVNADAKFSLSKVKFLAFSQYTAILVSKTAILSARYCVNVSALIMHHGQVLIAVKVKLSIVCHLQLLISEVCHHSSGPSIMLM